MTKGKPSTSPSFEPPRINTHEWVAPIRRGSYGDVWLGRSQTGSLHAVKIIWRASFDSARPYEREFEGIMQYEPISRKHPSLVQILQVGRDDERGCFYYVMELADNLAKREEPDAAAYQPKTLRSVLDDGKRFSPAECLDIGISIGQALGFLHEQRLVHRDIKPSNVIFVGGRAKLADIGLVCSIDATVSMVGTHGFIPPEGPGQVTGDIFALGKTIYEMFTGLSRLDYPKLPESFRHGQWPDKAKRLNEVILRACAPKPEHRHPSVGEIVEELEAIQCGQRPSRSRVVPRWLLAIVGLLAGLSGWLVFTPEEADSDWDYEYRYRHVYATNATDHIVERYNVEKITEWQSPPVTYWAPVTNGVEARIVYRFQFSNRVEQVYLNTNVECWDLSESDRNSGRGAAAILASVDGIKWLSLTNRLEPVVQWGGELRHEGLLPAELVGGRELYLKIKMLAEGETPDSRYSVVQHGRANPPTYLNSGKNEFELKASFVRH